MSSRRRKPNSTDPRKSRRPRRDIHAAPADFVPPMIEGNLAELAAEAGTTPAEFLASLDNFEAARHLVRLATDDPNVVRIFLVMPEQYDRMRKAADFFVTDAGRELERWVESWIDDPTITADVRESLETVAVAVIDGNGTYDGGDFVITVGGDGIDDDADVYAIGYPQGYQPTTAVRDE